MTESSHQHSTERVHRILNVIDWPEGHRPTLKEAIRESLMVVEGRQNPILYRPKSGNVWSIFPIDFGFGAYWSDGTWTTYGWGAQLGNANVMPGAMWFYTPNGARRAIDIYEDLAINENTARSTIDEFYRRVRGTPDIDIEALLLWRSWDMQTPLDAEDMALRLTVEGVRHVPKALQSSLVAFRHLAHDARIAKICAWIKQGKER